MNAPFQKMIPLVTAGLLTAFTFTGCETPGQTALAGAATGAALGGIAGGSGRDALRGAAIGAGAGYVAGRVAQNQRRRAYEQGLADRDGYYYDDARYYRDGRYYDSGDRVVVRRRTYYTAPAYRRSYYRY